MYVTLVAINSMSQANGGHGGIIVNIASIVGTEPSPGIPIYSATKHGVVGFTRSLVVSTTHIRFGIRIEMIENFHLNSTTNILRSKGLNLP